METLTEDQLRHLAFVVLKMSIVGGLLGALALDLVRIFGLALVDSVGAILMRSERIRRARGRAKAYAEQRRASHG